MLHNQPVQGAYPLFDPMACDDYGVNEDRSTVK